MLTALSKFVRRFLMPISRSAVILLGWTHRHTLGLWFRSIRDEVRRDGPIERHRLRTLISALAKVTVDRKLANAPELRRLWIAEDTVEVETDPHWSKRSAVETALRTIDHINVVNFTAPQSFAADVDLKPASS
jgi:hypothetical protein